MATESEADETAAPVPASTESAPGALERPSRRSPVMVTRSLRQGPCWGRGHVSLHGERGLQAQGQGAGPVLEQGAGARGSFGERSAAPLGVPAPLTAQRAGQSLTPWQRGPAVPAETEDIFISLSKPPVFADVSPG